jgi:hypothetical protein
LTLEDLSTFVGLRIKRDLALLTLMATNVCPGHEAQSGVHYVLFDELNKQLPLAWQLDDNQVIMRGCEYRRLPCKNLAVERDIIGEMEVRLQLPVSCTPNTGSPKLDRAFERHAKRSGHASFGAMCDAIDAARKSRLTPHVRQAAHARLEAMFEINLADERKQAARKADIEVRKPLYEQGCVRVV